MPRAILLRATIAALLGAAGPAIAQPAPQAAPPVQPKPQTPAAAKPEAKPDPKAIEAEDKAAAEIGAAAPTASQESGGIGPRSIEAGRIIPRTEGPKREVTDQNGNKRLVRIIAPNIIPVPEARKP